MKKKISILKQCRGLFWLTIQHPEVLEDYLNQERIQANKCERARVLKALRIKDEKLIFNKYPLDPNNRTEKELNYLILLGLVEIDDRNRWWKIKLTLKGLKVWGRIKENDFSS
jgi:hypothetical protein